MIVRASALGMGVGRFSIPLREVGVIAMPGAWLDTTRRVYSVIEVPPGAWGLRRLVPGVAVGVLIDGCCEADGVEATR